MKIFRIIFLSLILPICFGNINSFAQLPENRFSKQEYIAYYKDIAIEKMNTFGIPASITLSQGILESASGNSRLAKKANNHFGIKCHKGWSGKRYHMDDDAKNECFRKYKNPEESFKDHSLFLTTRDRYAFLFDLEITDYKGWAKGLKKAGYATNPKYPQLLINIIEEYELYKLDKLYNKDLANRHRPKVKKEVNERNNQFSAEDFEPVNIGSANRQIYANNGIKLIYARKGDTFYKIAQDFNIYTWQVYKYNDLKKKDNISEGQIIYLEAKKNKGNNAYHLVKPGETLYDISQLYGVKLKKICKYNTLKKNATLFPDQKIKLRQ
ncbi:MAG: glucosaminidase domain-containing protein [Bacteroidales bacterium]|nr:glucosaminidase domain-containing protein [Bacteroidales bacterium]